MSSAAPPDMISASSAGASNKKKKQKRKPKKPIDTDIDAKLGDGGQQLTASPREEQTGDEEPHTPVVSKPPIARASTVTV